MLKRLLVGLDGSADSRAALDLAIRRAARRGAALGGLAIVDEPGIHAPEPVPLGGGAFREARDEARLEDASNRVDAILDDFRDRCGRAGVDHRAIRRQGDPTDCIVAEAARFDLVVLGRRTQFHFATQDGPDHVLTDVLHRAPRPVVTTPPADDGGPPTPDDTGRPVLLAYDGSLQAERALFALASLGPDAPVHVVGVGRHRDSLAPTLDAAADYLAAHGFDASIRPVVTDREVADALLDEARHLGAGLIAMGAYGQPAFREFFLGSVTRALLEGAGVPLFLFH